MLGPAFAHVTTILAACMHLTEVHCGARLEAAAPRTHDEIGALADAPRCDPTRPEECLTYCYVMEDGSMVRQQNVTWSK